MKNRLLPLIFAFLAVTSVSAQKCGTYDGAYEEQKQKEIFNCICSDMTKLEIDNLDNLYLNVIFYSILSLFIKLCRPQRILILSGFIDEPPFE